MFTKFFLLTVLLSVAGLSVAHAQGPMVPPPPAPPSGKVAHITVIGNVHVPTADILARLNQKSAMPPDARATDAERLVNVAAVKDIGLFQSVEATTAPDPAGGIDVTCTVAENPVVHNIKITANTPDGKPSIPAYMLISRMHTAEGQVLNTKTLVADINDLFNKNTGFMRAQGYLCDVSNKISIDPNSGVLRIPLIEAFIDTLKVQGNGPVPTADVLALLGVKSGDVFNINAMQQGLRRLGQTHQFVGDSLVNYTSVAPGKVAVTVSVRLPRPPFGTLAAVPQKSETIGYGGPVGGFVIVPVRINDRLTGHFLVGTNVDLSQISTAFAANLGLTPQAMLVGGQPYFIGTKEAASVALDRLTLGGMPGVDVQNLSLPVVDLSALSKQIGQTIDGAIGADLLSRMTVGIDFPRRRVTFWNHGHLSAAERSAAGFEGGVEMPTTSLFGTIPTLAVTAQIQNGPQTKSTSLLIATGNETSILPAADFQALGLKPISHADNPEVVVGRATCLRFGGLSVGTPLFQLDAVNDNTTLGMNALSRYRMLLDGPAGMAYFAPEVTVAGGDPHRASWTVPFQFNHLTTPLLVVEVSINGHAPLPFIFDTGWSQALMIDRRTARVLGLAVDGKSAGMINDVIPFQTAPVTTAVLQGRTPADNVTVSLEQAAVMDLSLLGEVVIEPHVVGIIGSGMLQDTAVHFDFPHRLLTFLPASASTSGPPDAPLAAGASVLPLSEGLRDGLYFAAFAPAFGPPVRLEVDSGSEGSALPYEMRAQLKPTYSAIDAEWMFGSMWLGQGVTLSQPPLPGMPPGHTNFFLVPASDSLHQPTLGMNLLSRLSVTLDIPRMQLTLAPPTTPTPPTYGGWVGTRLTQDKNWFRITQTLPTSPAARAGLKAGDALLSVDGRPLQGQSLFSARTLIDGLAGTPAAFQIRRGNAPPRLVRFRRADKSGDPPSPLDGVYGQRKAVNPFKVDAVVPGCPADKAGITAGDTITAINGQVTARLTDAQWETLLLLTRLILTVSHDGASRTVVLADAPK